MTVYTDEIADFLDAMERAATHEWVVNSNRPETLQYVGFCDPDGDGIGGMDAADIMQAVTQIRCLVERCDNLLANLDHILEGT